MPGNQLRDVRRHAVHDGIGDEQPPEIVGGEPQWQGGGWRPHVRGRLYKDEGPHDKWLDWERADFISWDYLHGYWQRNWPGLAAAAYAGPDVRENIASLPYNLRTALEQAPGDPGTRWEVRLSEVADGGRTDIVVGPDPATAVLQQVYRLLGYSAEPFNIDEVRLTPSDQNRFPEPGWPWTVHVTTVPPYPGTRTEDGTWICGRNGHIFYARRVSGPETAGAAATAPGRMTACS